MKRREFVALMGSALAAPIARAQQPAGRVFRIGALAFNPRAAALAMEVFERRMRELGYAEGTNLVIDWRSADLKLDRLPALAAELVATKPDVILGMNNPATAAARAATQSIPIVMTTGLNVVSEGLVASLAKPGGNVTGVVWDAGLEIYAKRLQFLKEAVPSLSRVALFWMTAQETLQGAAVYAETVEKAAAALGVRTFRVAVKDEHDFERAFTHAVSEGANGLYNLGLSTFHRYRKEFVGLANRHRLPDAHFDSAFVDAGGLLSYAPSLAGLFRQTAEYVDKIFKGAKPADLPVAQPTTFELTINLKTAKTLGLKLPQSLLLRADRVIE